MSRVARSVFAALTLVVLIVGVPILLARFGTWPFHQLPTGDQLSAAPGQALTDTAVFAILTVAAWAAWTAFTLSVALEVIATVRGSTGPRLPMLAPVQGSARQLVASLLMTATLTGPFATGRAIAAPPLTTFHATISHPTVEMVHEQPPVAEPVDTPTTTTSPTTADLPVIRVAPGDSPWSLAEHHLGDGLRWRELWDLNRGVPQPGGRAWIIEDQIDVGWQLRMPSDATDLPAPSPVEPESVADAPVPDKHVVTQGETLSEIARHELGDPDRYPEIFDASQSTEQPGGTYLTDPDLILPGWTLQIPTPAADAPAPTEAGPVNGTAPSSSPPVTEPPVTAQPPAISTPSASTQTTTTTAPTRSTDIPDTSTPVRTAPASPASSGRPGADHDPEPADEDRGGSILPGLGAGLAGITGATILATGLAALIRRRRQRQPARRPTTGVTETELAIVRASDVPLVRWAGQALGAMAAHLDPRRISGIPVAVELSAETGIEILWDTPQPVAPTPWEVADGGWAWRLAYDPDAPVPPDEFPSPLPALVTVGHREGRQLLINLEALGSLAVTGDPDAAESLVRAMALELATSEDLADAYLTVAGTDLRPDLGLERVEFTTLDDALAGLEAAERSTDEMLGEGALTTFAVRCGTRGTHIEASVFMVRGSDKEDHARIDRSMDRALPHRGRALVVLGDESPAAARLTVSADGRAHLAPLGLDFEAAGLAPETEELVGEFLASEAADDTEDDPPHLDAITSELSPAEHVELLSVVDADREPGLRMSTPDDAELIDLRIVDHQIEPVGPSRVEPPSNGNGHTRTPKTNALITHPRLLVKVLGRPHVPDRPDLGRREIVLAAYLACHEGPTTTSGVQDAIWNGRAVESKTLWNLIARTRRALGSFDDGTPVMPQADRVKGTITLATGVMSDLFLLRASYERALGSSSAEAITLLRDALDLIEGPPFDAPGYDWAHHTHQYVAEASALIEQAAEHLACLAQADGDTDLARHALVQGLRALPGNEVLYRRRMQLEHDAGNLAGVKAAYDELTSLLADLESDPSEATGNLLHILVRPGPVLTSGNSVP